MADKPDLNAAYTLRTPEDSKRLYADWADTYDSGFAEDMDFALPSEVAAVYVGMGGTGPLLDLGAGTGLCGAALALRGVSPLHGTDISPEMLDVALKKNVYETLFEGNLLDRLPVEDAAYQGAVSTGTFTTGHVGPDALDEVVRILRPGGLAVISVHAEHWQAQGFNDKLAQLSAEIAILDMPLVRIYGTRAHGPHKDDMSRLLIFRRT